jgi:hypothetical protein
MKKSLTRKPHLFKKSEKSASNAKNETIESERATGNEHVWAISFEGMYSSIDNECWDLIEECLSSPDWYIDRAESGIFWRADAMNCRFVVKQAVFVRKLSIFSTKSDVVDQLGSFHTETSSSIATRSSSRIPHFMNNRSKETENLNANSKDDSKNSSDKMTVHQGNLMLKFLLLEPLQPAPMRGGHSFASKQMSREQIMSSHYAKRWIESSGDHHNLFLLYMAFDDLKINSKTIVPSAPLLS